MEWWACLCVSLAAHVPSMYCLLSFAQNDGSWLIRQLCPRVGKFSLYPDGEARGLASLTRDGPQKAPRSRVVRIRVNSNQCAKIVLSQEFLVYSPSSALFLAFLGQLAGNTPVTASVCILLRPNRNILCGYTNSEYIKICRGQLRGVSNGELSASHCPKYRCHCRKWITVHTSSVHPWTKLGCL